MSSILDALRKLEEERAAANEPPGADIDGVAAERDLIGGGRSSGGLRLTPATLLLGALGLAALLAVSSTAAVMVAMRAAGTPMAALPSGTASPAVTAAPAPAAEAITPAAETVVVSEPAAPTAVVTPQASEPAPVPAPVPAAPAPAPPRLDLDAAKPAAPAVREAPAPTRIAQLESIPMTLGAPEEAPAPTVEEARKTEADYPADPSLWPRLSKALKIRLVGDKKLNMARPMARPRASALVDMDSVYLDEVIPGTKARLVEVNGRGIGIEIVDTGERYYWPMGT